MLFDFLERLRQAGLPVSFSEHLVLLQALSTHLGTLDLDSFYQLSRLTLIKNEALYDRFDQVFADYWAGRELAFEEFTASIPSDWLHGPPPNALSEAQKAQVEALGGWDALMKTLRERLAEQQEAHHGGNKWIGTGGTSPFGHGGYHPEGVRIGGESGQRRAVKVWEQRRYRDLDGNRELGTRNYKMALRKLRRLARQGTPEQFDLEGTVRATADNAGLLDIRYEAERRNTTKVLLLLDIGGSMDWHVNQCEMLFSAARAEFRRLDHLYFHNCVYEHLWRDNRRRHDETLSTFDMLHTFDADHRVLFIGDATMSPYEIAVPGGSVEHWNEEAGAIWLQRVVSTFAHSVWLNPVPEEYWNRTPSIRLIRELMQNRMFPLTVDGLQDAIDTLRYPMTPKRSDEPTD